MALPLTFVVVISMFKDAYEDYKRHESDSKENNTCALVYSLNHRAFVQTYWKDIRPGHLVKVVDEEVFPADVVIIKSSDTEGSLYIETKSLDGETNLKSKEAVAETNTALGSRDEEVRLVDGKITCELPNNSIYKFEGTM